MILLHCFKNWHSRWIIQRRSEIVEVQFSISEEQTQVLQELLQGLNKDELEGLITELKDVNARNEEEETLTGKYFIILTFPLI